MVNIKSFKDGNRLILVIEDCTGETAIKANNFIADILGVSSTQVTTNEVPAVLPQDVDSDNEVDMSVVEPITHNKPFTEPISEQSARAISVKGPSETLGKALDTGDTEAIVELCFSAKQLPEATRISVLALCKDYLRRDCLKRNPEIASIREVEKFCNTYELLIKNSIKQILDKAGYSTLKDFLSLSDDYIIQDAYQSILDALIGRLTED